MPKYLLEISYTAEGVKGLQKDGGSKRRAAAQAAIQSVGGTLESMYFAFGERDVIVIVDMPDTAAATASAINLAASGSVTCKTTVLVTPEEVDAAIKKTVSYTRPGQ